MMDDLSQTISSGEEAPSGMIPTTDLVGLSRKRAMQTYITVVHDIKKKNKRNVFGS